jgi:hypothetical protein
MTTNIISILQQYAISKGGNLLSNQYINNKQKLSWQCSEGHIWRAHWNSVKDNNSWCPTCAGKVSPTIVDLQQYAISKGGKLLSTKYIDNSTKMTWQCSQGHNWETTWTHVKDANNWCAICSQRVKPTIRDLQQYAISHNGKLLSNDYKSNKHPLIWECKDGHKWKATWGNIKLRSSWCPECKRFKTELEIKTLLEQALNIVFTKTRFIYKSNRYEFDGYNEEHKIAFEYHGYQHYIYPNYWHRTKEIFDAAKQRDKNKEQYCIESGIKLIVIPYTYTDLNTYIDEVIHGL